MGEKRGRWEAITLIRLHILAEGQTEEDFVKVVLAPVLCEHGILVNSRSVKTGRNHGRIFRGGLVNYEHLARDLTLWMKEDQKADSWFTTMIDFYALPNNFPGRKEAALAPTPLDRVAKLESELSQDIVIRLNKLPISRRFIPYIQLHEFEALLFSDTAGFLEAFPGNFKAVEQLTAIRAQFPNPEDINDGPLTAPSKRILSLLPDYQKRVAGLLIARRIGLTSIRGACRHFDEWLTKLTRLFEAPLDK